MRRIAGSPAMQIRSLAPLLFLRAASARMLRTSAVARSSSVLRTVPDHRLWIDSFRNKLSAFPQQPGPRRPRASYVENFLRFRSDPAVFDEYVDPYGAVRVGKVLEDLDALAGAIAYLHISGPDPDSHVVVTASVDRIDLLRPIPVDRDIKMSGFVTFVGSSSIEVSIKMESCPKDGLHVPSFGQEQYGLDAAAAASAFSATKGVEQILTAKFIMVSLDPSTGKTSKVNSLLLESQEDEHLYQLGAEHRLRKKEARAEAPINSPPKPDEMHIIHELYKEYTKYLDPSSNVSKPENVVWMKDAVQESLTICMPQQRNVHNKVFGGYLMRKALELAYANALIFVKSPIVFVALDDITFRRPVNIGSLLSLRSQVVFSTGAPSRSFQVSVVADVIDPMAGTRETTNTFHFTFSAPNSDQVPRIMPQTYDESMRYIEGRRRKLHWLYNQSILSYTKSR